MSLYAAYAGNLDARLMARRAPHSPMRGTGWLSGWRLTFGQESWGHTPDEAGGPEGSGGSGWDSALVTIVEDGPSPQGPDGAPPAQVFVALYDIAPMDEALLDRWEGVGLGIYRRARIRVHTLDGDEAAWCHVLDGYEGGLPSARYLGEIADAAESAGAPHDYVMELRKRPC
ncbi:MULTISPECIES: gamma-glutamylcyclotransferase [Streptomyces]|uniref:Gamma-glutamylcyclotransferase n=2 Tax=Streptomyces cacaoi TaxID=1898 RepID=A0A4Y3R9Y2_STRCI|nr:MULTISPECIES: gamma-glutamylcyclotransferase [Streptomyces]NNG86647.1 gamma-glutamylcyclotransferase [Streptomyces cacaoi]QHF97251.1 gamma-glutamylcyclotransferase [Streptomyces sp. NHF165]GEB54219.1 gamma-glutamylcyclotransferase [Streptomyces cacaoi]